MTLQISGARQHGFLPKDALSDLTGPKPPPQRQSDTSSSSDDDDDDDVQDDTEDDEDDEDDLAPPLPPRRSESLLKSNFYNNGTQEQVQQDSNPALNADLPAVILLQGKKIHSAKKKSSILLSAEEKVKIYLKPKFNEGLISKEIYKIIMRKCVGKIYAKHKASVPRSEVSIQKVKKLVNEYVEIYKSC